MTKGTFLPSNDYNDAVEVLADLFDKPCPFEEASARRAWLANEIKTALGVHGNIWPAEIYGACVIAGLEDAEARGAAHG
jgi:hypothetical protein